MPRPCLPFAPLRQLTSHPLRPSPSLSILQPSVYPHTRLDTPNSTPIRQRNSYSSASSRWKLRQGNDFFARTARVQGLKSRAAFKLLEIHSRHAIFAPDQTIVDLGYAPGSWSQVALERTRPAGRVVGIDLIPAMPPRGVSTIQGDFLEGRVRGLVKSFLREGRRRDGDGHEGEVGEGERSYIDRERRGGTVTEGGEGGEERLVDVSGRYSPFFFFPRKHG